VKKKNPQRLIFNWPEMTSPSKVRSNTCCYYATRRSSSPRFIVVVTPIVRQKAASPHDGYSSQNIPAVFDPASATLDVVVVVVAAVDVLGLSGRPHAGAPPPGGVALALSHAITVI